MDMFSSFSLVDKYNHNDGLYHQEGVFNGESIFLHFHRSISYSHSNLTVWQTGHVQHQNITSIPDTKEITSVAHNFYFRSNKYGCNTSPRPMANFCLLLT